LKFRVIWSVVVPYEHHDGRPPWRSYGTWSQIGHEREVTVSDQPTADDTKARIGRIRTPAPAANGTMGSDSQAECRGFESHRPLRPFVKSPLKALASVVSPTAWRSPRHGRRGDAARGGLAASRVPDLTPSRFSTWQPVRRLGRRLKSQRRVGRNRDPSRSARRCTSGSCSKIGFGRRSPSPG
jgi:hypothetical protein